MKRLSLEHDTFDACVQEAAEAVRSGGVVLFPTDTLYGLAADAFSNEAVDAIYAIKGRDEGKPIHCIVPDMTMAEQYAEIDDAARMLARELLPGALTLIVRKKTGLDTGICRGIPTIGVRIPAHPFALALAGALGRPVTATSANKSGEKPERSVDMILEQLGGSAERIALVIDEGELPPREPSTVVDLTLPRPVILREGAIPAMDIWDVLALEQD